MEFTTGLSWTPLPLLHCDLTELVHVRHLALLHILLEDSPQVLDWFQVWKHNWQLDYLQLPQEGSCHLGGVFRVVIMLENCHAQFPHGEDRALLQIVTVHIGIHVSLNEP